MSDKLFVFDDPNILKNIARKYFYSARSLKVPKVRHSKSEIPNHVHHH